ncbi:MAG: cell division protein FtsZ, partial [Lysobacteraceae bacterium]
SEDATVVLGTVLDPDMQDEVRVTVVATGLNRNAAARQPIGRGEIQSQREPQRAPIKLVRDATTGMPLYDANSMDPVSGAVGGLGLGLRRGSAEPAAAPAPAPAIAELPDYLDIPAFLRRQAD